jgi:hypothetical protein
MAILRQGYCPKRYNYARSHQKILQTTQIVFTNDNAAGTIRSRRLYRRRFEFRETSMKTTSIMLAGLAALTLGSVALAQQPMTGTVTRIDRIDGIIAIQLQKTPTQSGTVGANTGGANTSGPAEEIKTKVQGNLLNTLHAGDRVKFSLTEAGGTKTISNVERQ